MAKIYIDTKFKWVKEDPDLSTCASCDSIICGNMYKLYLECSFDGKKSEPTRTDYQLCESCYGLLDVTK